MATIHGMFLFPSHIHVHSKNISLSDGHAKGLGSSSSSPESDAAARTNRAAAGRRARSRGRASGDDCLLPAGAPPAAAAAPVPKNKDRVPGSWSQIPRRVTRRVVDSSSSEARLNQTKPSPVCPLPTHTAGAASDTSPRFTWLERAAAARHHGRWRDERQRARGKPKKAPHAQHERPGPRQSRRAAAAAAAAATHGHDAVGGPVR